MYLILYLAIAVAKWFLKGIIFIPAIEYYFKNFSYVEIFTQGYT